MQLLEKMSVVWVRLYGRGGEGKSWCGVGLKEAIFVPLPFILPNCD